MRDSVDFGELLDSQEDRDEDRQRKLAPSHPPTLTPSLQDGPSEDGSPARVALQPLGHHDPRCLAGGLGGSAILVYHGHSELHQQWSNAQCEGVRV